ncbi:single-stranded DNA-binding protein [Nocardioides sp. cx-173]|uniref:single-stranded DNA-binding protein n=1 Tax=Nocardioides sp. cx-173 TaxID=2898796 RepID=UPI001E394185|nr:single-stranded DNA-binding protein [Nocardioides sp. cx-173]MCD4527384.1 single-stranded DNA-binding protein [Nocardioides sp. cx-173]UGB43835.1 single-stranded DNA-binding protein [Nocardioides sp. cx-173]
MSAQTTEGGVEVANEVRLVGRISRDPELKELPSGDSVWTFRVVVPRAPAAARPHQSVDALECCVWSGRLRRSVAGWRAGDRVAVEGSLRRRFFRSGHGVASLVEVEVSAGRLIRRAAT